MWDLLLALAQIVSVLLVVAGFGLVTWYRWWHSTEQPPDD